MFQVRIHGRGGQGVVSAAELLAVAAFIEARQPRYFFCGHIHEAEGVVAQLGAATTGVNVGKAGYLLDLAKL